MSKLQRVSSSCLILMLVVVTVALIADPAVAGKPLPPLAMLKGPYLQNVTTNSIVIMWQTNQPSDSRVDYGLTSSYTDYVYDPAMVEIHEVQLTGLSLDELYHYKVTSETATESVSSEDNTFETAIATTTPFRFVVYGDTRSQPTEHAAVVSAIISSDPRIFQHTGDFVSDGRREDDWQEEYFDPAQPLLRNTTLFPCLGNHERNADPYYNYFDPPDGGGDYNERWFSYDYGNCHVTVIDTDADYSPGSEQYTWIVNDLQNASNEWLFAIHHHPAYSSGSHGGTENVQNYLVPLYETYGVDMVFSGHDHLYERSYKDGVYYVTSGGGGAPLHDPNQNPNPYQQYVEKTYHHCTIDVDSASAIMKARHNDGSVFDTVEMAHGPQPPVADFSGEPLSGDAPLTVSFTDLSSGSPTSWDWTFGDGGTDTVQHPSHEYTAANSYTVSLTAANAQGQDTETKPDYISVTQPGAPVADFSGNPTSGPPPLTVYFTDLSSGSPTSWDWTFGDGGTDTAQHPTHEYTAADTYTVSLQACNASGCDTETKIDYITVGEAGDHTAYDYAIESGTYVSGTLADTQASDDSYLVIDTVRVTGNQATIIKWYFDTNLSSISTLSLSQEWRHDGAPPPQRHRTWLWNWNTNGWEEVDNQLVDCSQDNTTVVNVTSPAPYLSPGGEVHARIWCGDTGKTAFSHYIDLIKVTAAP